MRWPWQKKRSVVNPFSVYKVLRELVGLMAGVRAEVRMLRKENELILQNQKEIIMSTDALRTNVLHLIDLAEAAKNAAAANPDQPAIDDLNQKVVDAIAVLTPPIVAAATAAGTPPPPPAPTGAPAASGTGVTGGTVDPNAPVV